jgi:hypothetical protein
VSRGRSGNGFSRDVTLLRNLLLLALWQKFSHSFAPLPGIFFATGRQEAPSTPTLFTHGHTPYSTYLFERRYYVV